MLYVDVNNEFFDISTTMGDVDVNSIPTVVELSVLRHGTNNAEKIELDQTGMEIGGSWVTFKNIPTSIFAFSGEYEFLISDITDTENPVVITHGILMAVTTPITRTQYGTDKERGEYKGHL